MTNISQAIRSKRFPIKTQSNIDVNVATKTGIVIKMKLKNCSLNGIAAELVGELSENQDMEIGQIQPAAKLSWSSHEIVLGRVVLRNIRSEKNGYLLMGFSLVDSKLPLDGIISHELDIDHEKGLNPLEFELSPDKFNLGSFQSAGQTNVDLFGKCKQFAILHEEWTKTPKFQYRTPRLPSKGTRVLLQRKRKNGRHDYLVMGSNDYWGLASHPKVLEAAKDAIDKFGFGSTGSPVTTGSTAIHEELTEFLAKIFQKEKALLFNSGYTANIGTITGLVNINDLVIADVLAHTSIQNGMQMCKGKKRFFKHNDVIHLEKILEKERSSSSGTLVITEGVFSMDGDCPAVDQIIEISRRFNARTFVDEAHSFGVLGRTGLGVCEKFDALDKVDIIMGTFSKMCGGIGGFIVTDKEIIDWLYFYSQSHLFSIALPPSTAAAALTALKIFKAEPERLQRLKHNIQHFVQGLKDLGYPIDPNHESAVIPVVIGNEDTLGKIHQCLMDAGVYSIPMVYPAVSRNSSRFRFTVMAEHTTSDLDYVLHVLEVAMEKANFSFSALADKNIKIINSEAA